jgi:hypothetical protein
MTRATTRLREKMWNVIEPLFGNRATFEKSFETRYRNGVDYEANTWVAAGKLTKDIVSDLARAPKNAGSV